MDCRNVLGLEKFQSGGEQWQRLMNAETDVARLTRALTAAKEALRHYAADAAFALEKIEELEK